MESSSKDSGWRNARIPENLYRGCREGEIRTGLMDGEEQMGDHIHGKGQQRIGN